MHDEKRIGCKITNKGNKKRDILFSGDVDIKGQN